jgi:hypothetical protein
MADVAIFTDLLRNTALGASYPGSFAMTASLLLLSVFVTVFNSIFGKLMPKTFRVGV